MFKIFLYIFGFGLYGECSWCKTIGWNKHNGEYSYWEYGRDNVMLCSQCYKYHLIKKEEERIKIKKEQEKERLERELWKIKRDNFIKSHGGKR